MAEIEGEAGLFVGQSRYGKTTAVIEHVTRQAPGQGRRCIVWSIKEKVDDYAGRLGTTQVARTRKSLLDKIKRHAHDTDARIVYVPRDPGDFGWWAKVAMKWAKYGAEANLYTTVIAEELADVTSPAKAPPGWGELCRQGLGYGANVYGVSQRPAESDKTIVGNASFVHCHYLRRAGDRKYMAEELDTRAEHIARLARFQFVQAWAGESGLRHGETKG
jgi:hypothetical protein